VDNWGRSEPPAVDETTTGPGRSQQWRAWYSKWASEIGLAEYILVASLVTAAALAVFAMGGIR
jgi:hypothetical protein